MSYHFETLQLQPYDKDLIKRFSESFDATIDTMINLCEANN